MFMHFLHQSLFPLLRSLSIRNEHSGVYRSGIFSWPPDFIRNIINICINAIFLGHGRRTMLPAYKA